MTIQVKHATSVQGADCADKSVNATQWNEDHYVSGAASVLALNALSAAVSTVAANLSAEIDARIALSGTVSTNAAQVSTLSVQVSAVSAAVSIVAANLSILSVQHSTLSALESTLSAQVSTLSVALSNEISARALSVNNLSAIVSTNLAQLSTLSVQVSAVSAAVSVVAANLSTLSVQVSADEARLSTVSVVVSALSVQVTNLSVLHSTLSVQVSTTNVAVSVLSVNLSVLSVQVTNLSALQSTLSVQVSALSVTVSTVAAQVSNLSVAVSARAGREALVRVANAQVLSVSALANISAMALSVGAGNTYAFKYMVIYQVASVTTGLKLGLTFPGMTQFAATASFPSGATGTANAFTGPISATGGAVASLSVQAAATNYYATVEGICMVSTSGTLQLQGAIDASGNSVQGTIVSGTTGHIWRMV